MRVKVEKGLGEEEGRETLLRMSKKKKIAGSGDQGGVNTFREIFML